MSKNKPPVSVSKMAELCQLSRQRFYDYLKKGVFPPPIYEGGRPMYTQELQTVVLEIRKTGVALDGRTILFNKPRAKRKNERLPTGRKHEYKRLIESLQSLGLQHVQEKQVEEALKFLYPQSGPDIDSGDVIKAIFLYMKS